MQILKIKTEKRRIGDIGEEAAARFMRKQGYKILERGYAARGHEIDLIAEDRENLVFVEVKTRTLGRITPKEPRPASAVTPDKQRGIFEAARWYYAPKSCAKRKRFDIIEVYLTDEGGKYSVSDIKHLISAFTLNTAHGR